MPAIDRSLFSLIAGTVWPATPSLGMNCYNWYTEATSGVAWAHCGSCKTTKFVFPITLAQSYNKTLWQLTGRQIGREAWAVMNEGDGFRSIKQADLSSAGMYIQSGQ